MIIILNIETSTKNCSISLAKNGIPYIVVEEYAEYYSHAEKIHCFIASILEANLLKVSDLNAICINKGPGSYTGLRIGLSVAKGICYGLKKPLLSIDTLSILIEKISLKKGIIIPMIPSYISIYDENKTKLTLNQGITIEKDSFKESAQNNIVLLGDGAKKNIKIPGYFFLKVYPSSQEMAFISYKKFQKKYLKIWKLLNRII